MRVGLIGLGLMGQAIAKRLLAADYAVAGFDLREEARNAASALGVSVLNDARDAAANTEAILLSLLTSENRRDLLFGPQQLAAALPKGALLLDTTTGRPGDLVEDYDRLAPQGIQLIDIGISGSSQVVAEHRAVALVGIDEDSARPFRDILNAFTRKQYFFGRPGRGHEAKLIVNLVFGLNRLVLAEALGLAERHGFDLARILDVLKSGETHSTAMDTKGPMMLAHRYEPAVARLGQHAKDVGLILEYARAAGARVPVSELHAALLAGLLDEGLGELDNAAIFEAYCPQSKEDAPHA